MATKKKRNPVRKSQDLSSTSHLESLSDNLPCALFRLSNESGDWCFTFLGNEIDRISGQHASDFIGKPTSHFRSLIPENEVELVENNISESIKSKQTYELEYSIKARDGHVRWLYETARPEFDDEGELNYFNGFIQDISERKQDETLREQVQESLIRHQNLHRQAEKIGQLGYWEWDEVNDRLISCSDQLSLIYEMTREEILSEFSSLEGEMIWIHPDDREFYKASVLTGDETLRGVDIEFRILTKSGKVRHVREISEIVLDDEGNRYRSFGTMQDITEQKQAEERLRYQFDLQKIVSELSGHFSVARDIDTSIDNSLQSLGEITDSDRVSLWQFSDNQQFTSKSHEWCKEGIESQFEIFQNVPMTRLHGLGVLEKIISGQPFYIADIYQLPPDGHEIRDFFDEIGIKSIVVLPITDEGEVVSFFTLNNPARLNSLHNPDISMLKIFGDSLFVAIERARAQIALLEAKDEAENAADIVNKTLQNIGQSVVMVDAEGKLLVYHDIFLDDINLTPEEAAKFETFEEAIRVRYPNDEAGFQRSMELARSDKKLVFEINTPNGRVIQTIHNPLEGGGFVRVYSDISEIKQIQKDLEIAKENAERSSDIANKTLHNIGQSILMVDKDWNLLVYNDIFLDDINISKEQAKQLKTFEDVIRLRYPDDEEAYNNSIALAKSNHKAVYEVAMPTGRVVEIRHLPLDDGGFVRTYTDISELKKIQNDLILAKEEAEDANQAKANFLATMSHEIRTPMSGVIGMVDLLKQTRLNTEQRHMLRTVTESGHTLLTVINDILDFSKIEAGKLEIELIPFSILDIVESTANTLSTTATNRGLRLITFVDPDLESYVVGDPVRVRQILSNLCSNAIKFSKTGEIVMRAELQGEIIDNTAKVCFSVSDQGIGISEDVQANLFQSFFQAEASTNRKFGGSGLGLAICKRLTELMGGEISVESEPGKGSIFRVQLSLECSNERDDIEKVTDLTGLNILLVTPGETEQEIYGLYLKYKNATVATLEDINSCTDACVRAFDAGSPYDVVILGPHWNRDEQNRLKNEVLANPELSSMKFVCLLKGRRRRARTNTTDVASIDVDPLQRNALLAVVAIAAGKASPEVFYKDHDEDVLQPARIFSIDEAREMGNLILVAEDNRINRDVIGQQLDLLGYAYEIVDDGKQALEAWSENDYGLLLTDCHMPNMDGFALTEAIRAQEADSSSRTPIVAITANTLLGEAERCLEVGMDDYLAKPVVVKELKKAIEKWLPATPGDIENTEDTDGNADVRADKSNGPIDEEVLRGMLGDDQTRINTMLQNFVDPLRESLREIEETIKNLNARELEMAAHKMKSSALVMGASQLAAIGQTLESASKEEKWNEIHEEAAKLGPSFEEIRIYIENL